MNADQQLVTPQLVAGRYLLLSWLGEGGMGSVYQARDIKLDEVVALKLLRQDWVRDASALEQFRREVKLARRIAHPNVVKTFDIGDHDGVPFLTMEFVPGRPLTSSVVHGGLPLRRVVEIGCALCAGLAAAHALGIVHRDLKPDNVLVTDGGRVAISDFGIAWTRETRGDTGRNTDSSSGTPGYMSPEQTLGSGIDARTDLYALGAILYELLTGVPAWEGPSPAAIAVAQATHAPPDPSARRPDLPAGLGDVVLGCLARDPARRLATAEQVRELLDAVHLPEEAAPRASAARAAVRPSPSPRADPGANVEHPRRRIAVLPLRSAGEGGDALLVDGMTDDLIDELSMTDGLQVRPRSAVMRFTDTDLDPRDLGRVLEVDAVVAGTMRREGEQLTLSIRLLSVADGFQVWARRFEYAPAALLSAARVIAAEVARALSVRWEASAPPVPEHQEVVELLLRARRELREFWLEHARRAEEMLVRALAIAPDAPMLLSALALARQRIWLHAGGAVAEEAARSTAEHAVKLAPRLPQAWLANGLVQLDRGEVVDGVIALRRAIELGRGVAEGHDALGKILIQVGAIGHGVHRLESAVRLDPELAPLCHCELARVRALMGDHDESEVQLTAAGRGASVAQRRFVDYMRARLDLWRGDREAARRYGGDLVGDAEHLLIQRAFSDAAAGALTAETSAALRQRFEDRGRTLRVRLFFGQILVEMLAATGADAEAVDTLDALATAGLIDRVWLDRCPLLARYAAEPRLAPARKRVHALADKIASAIRAGR
ncbi:MAG TPA: serine/threonine-protein kinase [Kofleriaceae bacterium]|nr:serine/threonine-protein kinase [Kofleriaceae bacterium]